MAYKEAPQDKVFGHIWYSQHSWHTSRAKADSVANDQRKHGMRARVYNNGAADYVVYITNKRIKRH
jgi:hypothetical protein